MSTLSKVFVVLLLIVSLMYLGIAATLFAHRIDWKKKYELELQRHADSIKQRDLVIAGQKAKLDESKGNERVLHQDIQLLQTEKKELQTALTRARMDIDDLKTQYAQLATRQGELADQLKASRRENEDLRKELNDTKADSSAARAERDQAVAELQDVNRKLEIARKDIGELERQTVELAREKDKQQLVLEELTRSGIEVSRVAARDIPKNLQGKVQAVSPQFNVAVISIGGDDGVKLGYPFTIYRGDKFVARGVVEKVERDWSVLRWDPAMMKEKEVLVGDDVSTSVISGPGEEPRDKK